MAIPIALGSLVSLVGPASSWFDTISKNGQYKEQLVMDAVEALNEALSKTSSYLALSEETNIGAKARTTQHRAVDELRRLWVKASSKLAPIDRDLSEIALMKSMYWANPGGWKGTELETARIGIDFVLLRTKMLIRERPRRRQR